MSQMEQKISVLTENNMNVFINKETDEVYKMRKQAEMTPNEFRNKSE